MSVQRHYFCLYFQKGPGEDGSFGCGHTGEKCPFGWHRCGRCGSFDHSARGSQCVAPPIPVHIELPTFDLALPSTCPPASSSSAVGVEGFGFKGEGKHANLGVEVPRPALVRHEDLPANLQATTSHYIGPPDIQEGPWTSPTIPPPIAAKPEEIQGWISANYRRLTNLCVQKPPNVGDSILWRGVKTGRSGGTSTTVEHFNAVVRHIEQQDGETFVYVD